MSAIKSNKNIALLAMGAVLLIFVAMPAAYAETVTNTYHSPNAEFAGEFGYSVAITGNIVVVGAPFETASGVKQAGHAYVIDIKSGTFTTLTSPNALTGGGGQFGFSVGISGSTVVVGAHSENIPGTFNAGRAYIFTTAGSLIATLTSPHPETGTEFGRSVGISGGTVVVGAPFETISAPTQAGRAYTFSSTTGSLIATLSSPNPLNTGNFFFGFGWSVAISGGTALVGAPFETASRLSLAGNAYTFSASTGTLLATFTSPKPEDGGEFGYSVAVSGGVPTTIVVGAPDETASLQAGAGHAYVFTTKGSLISTLVSPHPQKCGQFGHSVDVDGSRVVVGAPEEGTSAGFTYFFTATGSLFAALAGGQASGEFGWSVAVSGSEVVVGADSETFPGGPAIAGQAYLIAL